MRSAVLAVAVFAGMSTVVGGLYVAQQQQSEDAADTSIPLEMNASPAQLQSLAHDPQLGSFSAQLVAPVQAQVQPAPSTANVQAGQPVTTHDQAFHDQAWWAQRSPEHWVVQVLGSRSEAEVQQYIKAASDPAQYSYYEDLSEAQPWYVVVYGDYPSREIAEGVAEAHDFGGSAHASARSVAMIQADQVAAAAQQEPAAVPAPAPLPAPSAVTAPGSVAAP